MTEQLARVELPVTDGLREAIERFDCVGDRHEDDPIADEVSAFLRNFDFVHGIQNFYSSTFILVDDEQGLPRDILAYTTLAIDSVRLTTSERRNLDRPEFPDFGAIRIAMIGVDHRFQERGFGVLMLRGVVDMAMTVSQLIAVRFLLADANVRQQEWYEHHGWVVNRAKVYSGEDDEEAETVSMRLDLWAP